MMTDMDSKAETAHMTVTHVHGRRRLCTSRMRCNRARLFLWFYSH